MSYWWPFKLFLIIQCYKICWLPYCFFLLKKIKISLSLSSFEWRKLLLLTFPTVVLICILNKHFQDPLLVCDHYHTIYVINPHYSPISWFSPKVWMESRTVSFCVVKVIFLRYKQELRKNKPKGTFPVFGLLKSQKTESFFRYPDIRKR